MSTINEDIELAKLWANDAPNGQGWRGTCYRLAAEVERLRERNALLELELSVSASALLAGDAAIELAKLEIIRTESENKALRRMMAEDSTAEERLELLDACNAASKITEATK